MEGKLNWKDFFQSKLFDGSFSAESVQKIYRIEMDARTFFDFGDIMPEWMQLENIERGDKEIRYAWSSHSVKAICPSCHHESEYNRGDHDYKTVQDIPCEGMAVYHDISVCKYNCNNLECSTRIFAERIPSLLGEDARKTRRFIEYCIARAASSGCNRAEGDIRREGGVVSNDTLGRYIKAESAETVKANLESNSARVRVLCVDDFNRRKGDKSSGCTVFVDGETRRVLVMVRGTTKETAKNVMEKFSSVDIFSRDRATSYASAGKELGLTQVADRFHIIDNAQKAVEEALSAELPARIFIRSGDGWVSTEPDADGTAVPGGVRFHVAAEDVEERVRLAGLTEAKAKKYRDTLLMLELDSAGLRTAQIADSMGESQPYIRSLRRSAVDTLQNVSDRIAKRAETLKNAPPPKVETPGENAIKTVGGSRVKAAEESIVEPYRDTVVAMWKMGGNHRTIHLALIEMGFEGSANAIYQYILKLKKESPESMTREKPAKLPGWAGEFELEKAESLPDVSLDSVLRGDVYNEILRQARETRPGEKRQADDTRSTEPKAEAKKSKGSRPASAKTSPLPPYILDLMYGPEDDSSDSEPEDEKKTVKARC